MLGMILTEEAADDTPLQSRRKVQENTTIDHPAPGRFPFHSGRGQGRSLLLQIAIILPANIGKPAERIRARRHQPIQNRNDFLPDSVPQVERLGIARVFAKGYSCLAKIRRDLPPAGLIQRPNNLVVSESRHAGKTGESRPTEQPQQHRLRLIIGCMAYGDPVRSAFFSNLVEGPITKIASHRLQR